MSRKRRGLEFGFGLDSFLDVIANVIGILVRLLIVVWFSARTYTFLVPPKPTRARHIVHGSGWALPRAGCVEPAARAEDPRPRP